MQRVLVSATDTEVSRVCLGTMTFGSQVSEAEAARMVDFALDRGVNFIDTANVYNAGLSEEITGRILGARRSQIVLATKVRGNMGAGEDAYGGLSREAIFRAVEDSLKRLGTDYIDIYYLHQPDRSVDIYETIRAMNELVAAGKVRRIGTSNYAAWQMAEMAEISENLEFQVPTVAQPMYNALARGIEQEYLACTRRYNVTNVCYNPLAGGLLSGKQSLERGPLPGTRFDGNERYLKRFWHQEYFQAVEALRRVADGLGIALAEMALRWLCHREGAHCVILGASKFAHLEQNIEASQAGPLPDDALRACDEIWGALRGPTPQYNR
ncbi:MAG: aldo/keto reductase [Acidobacteriia bacterium]|nr:aldo/keto reductase [Terriglobia bacterium]MYG00863.1 aldo/keto reductase [Terriglobia bacterium]MYK09062.1 aldo/keto reductase [Terriglobia bacterium]